MAKETKELEKLAIQQSKKKSTVAKKSTKKVSAKKDSTSKKATTKKSTVKKDTTTKKSVAKKDSTSKKATTTKASVRKTNVKKSTEKKVKENKTSTLKKSTSTRKKALTTTVENSKTLFKSEYYDLPYMYNKTVVKVLAQTPKMLFIYWEISEDDRTIFKEKYGDNFFEKTHPILIVYNDTLHYSFEVDINNFANSWYLHINDSNCKYHVELGRRPYPETYNSQVEEPIYIPYYIYLTSSNEMSAPNDKMLFNPNIQTIRFRNVKTGQINEKDIRNFKFITNFGIFNIQDLYKYLYPNENFNYENIVIGNTSSGALSSSGMFSSQFK